MLFGYFLHNAKSDNPFSLQRTSRFCKPRISSPQRRLHTNKIKTFPKRDSRFCKPRISAQNHNFALTKLKPSQREIRGFANLESAHPKLQLHTNPIKSFAAPRLFPVAAATFFRLRRCPCRDGTLRGFSAALGGL